jgi:hypothetical protein
VAALKEIQLNFACGRSQAPVIEVVILVSAVLGIFAPNRPTHGALCIGASKRYRSSRLHLK